jgi:adenine-specific DNA-methyltransferase
MADAQAAAMIKTTLLNNEAVTSNAQTLEILHTHFPQCFNKEGHFDLDKFKDHVKAEVDVTHEGYDLNFLGKNYAKLLASVDTTTVIQPDVEHNSKPENANSQNLYISGDNLDGLKHLLKSYTGAVKCIYIDPPYNTGSDGFVYNDKFNYSAQELTNKLSISDEQAQKILDLTRRGSASHSAWLTFMYPRLLLARDLLTPDGVIFISIDDNEQANLKLLCDSVFGEENLISQIVVQSNKRGQTYKQLAKTHEYLLVYVQSDNCIINELKKELIGEPKSDSIGEFSERELRNRNPKFGRFNRPNLYYPIYINPYTIDKNGYCPISLTRTLEYNIEVFPLNSEGKESCWRWGTTKLNKNINENTIESNAVGRIKNTGVYGIYEKYRKETFKAKTIWFDDIVISNEDDEEDEIWDETGVITEQGSAELRKYDMGDIFDFPKPTYLVKKVLELGAEMDSICLDFFSGSATLAESVLRLNSNLGNRKFISIQLPENLDDKFKYSSASEKSKVQRVIDFMDTNSYPHTLDYVGFERIKRAAAKIKAETNADIDYGFKHYTLVEPSNDTIDKLELFNPHEIFTDNDTLSLFGKETVLETWLVKDGYGFGAKVEEVMLANYTVWLCGKHLYFIEAGFNENDMVALLDKYQQKSAFSPENIVIFGYSFNFSQTEMLRKNLFVLKDSHKNLKANFDIRY